MNFLEQSVPEDPKDLPAFWRELAAGLLPFNTGAAAVAEAFALHLERALHLSGQELVNLRQASAIGGYSVEHLSRMVKAGTIPNAGRSGAPRVRRCDVPHKPGRQGIPAKAIPDRRRTSQFTQVRRLVVSSSMKGGR